MRLRGHQLDGFNAALKSDDAAKAHQELQTACAVAEGKVPFVSASGSAADLRVALEESVKLQSHYAKLLNMHDGGERIGFKDADAGMSRDMGDNGILAATIEE